MSIRKYCSPRRDALGLLVLQGASADVSDADFSIISVNDELSLSCLLVNRTEDIYALGAS